MGDAATPQQHQIGTWRSTISGAGQIPTRMSDPVTHQDPTPKGEQKSKSRSRCCNFTNHPPDLENQASNIQTKTPSTTQHPQLQEEYDQQEHLDSSNQSMKPFPGILEIKSSSTPNSFRQGLQDSAYTQHLDTVHDTLDAIAEKPPSKVTGIDRGYTRIGCYQDHYGYWWLALLYSDIATA